MFKFVRTVILIVLYCAMAFGRLSADPTSTQQMRGVVTDATTGAPIPSASIWAFRQTSGVDHPFGVWTLCKVAEADSTGHYVFIAANDQEFSDGAVISVTAPGYAHVAVSNPAPPNGDPTRPIEVDFHLPAGIALTGKVVDADGKPVGGAQVVAILDLDSPETPDEKDFAKGQSGTTGVISRLKHGDFAFATNTSLDGTFRFDGWRQGDIIDVLATSPGFTPSIKKQINIGSAPIEMKLDDPAAIIAGAVRDAEGNPVPGCRVRAHYLYFPPPTLPEGVGMVFGMTIAARYAVTDSAGRYHLDTLWPGHHNVLAESADGRNQTLAVEKSFMAGRSEDIDLSFQRDIEISANLVDEDTGTSAAGVRLVSYDNYLNEDDPVYSDTSGAFKAQVEHNCAGVYYWLPNQDGTFRDTPDGRLDPEELKSTNDVALTIRIKRASTQRFQLVCTEELEFEGLSMQISGLTRPGDYRPDESGAFEITVQPGTTVSLVVNDPNRIYYAREKKSITAETLATTIEIPITRMSIVSGVVVDSQGMPIGGVKVNATHSVYMSSTCVTGKDGNFQVQEILPGNVAVAAEAEGASNLAPSLPVSLEVEPGEQVSGLRLVLQTGARVTGTVLCDPEENEGAIKIVLVAAPRREKGAVLTTTPNADGTFAFENVPTGAAGYQIMVQRRQMISATLELDSLPTQPISLDARDERQVLISPQNKLTAATVPLVDFSVSERFHPGQQEQPMSRISIESEVLTNGTLRLHRMLDHKYKIRMVGRGEDGGLLVGSAEFDGADKEHRSFTVMMESPACLRGRVVSGNGDPIAGATVEAILPLDPTPWTKAIPDAPLLPSTATTNENGEFELSKLFHEPYALTVTPPAGGSPVVVQADPSQSTEPLVIEFQQAASITVKVIGADGNAMAAKVRVGLDSKEQELLDALTKSGKIGEFETDASGVLEVASVPPGVYTIRLVDDRITSYYRSAIEPGASKTFTIDLRRYTEVSASFVVPPNELVKKTTIRLVKDSDDDWQDIFFFDDLNPGVLLGPGDYHWCVSFHEAVGWESSSFTIARGDPPSKQQYTIELARLKVVLTGTFPTPLKGATLVMRRFESENALQGTFSGFVDFDTSGSTVEFFVPAGVQELTARLGPPGSAGPTRVTLKPGETRRVELKVIPPPVPRSQAPLQVG